MGQPTRLDSPTKMCTDSGCARPLRARGLCASHYNRRYHPTPVRNVECEHCGRAYQTSRWNGRFCSTACHGRFKILQRQSNRCELPADHPVRLLIQQDEARALAARRWPQSRVWFTECVTCGSLFATRYTVSTCSALCARIKLADARREADHRRRARRREALVQPVVRAQIYKRDRWICQLCRKKVNRTALVPHPLAPTLDHIIPLHVGGTHEPANVWTAHFLCNAQKGDRGGGEQLALLG